MTVRSLPWIAAIGLLLGATQATAVDWHYHFNHLGRSTGLGWSDGYHSREGCPTEVVGRRKYPGYPGNSEYSEAPIGHSWMPARPVEGSPTPAARPAPPRVEAIEAAPLLAPPRGADQPQMPSAMFRPTLPR